VPQAGEGERPNGDNGRREERSGKEKPPDVGIERLRATLAYCARPAHLRRTVSIAIAVGVVLTGINQLDVILASEATPATAIKCALNFVVPFVVSNLGLLSGRRTHELSARDVGDR
jgi:hypothetical protein